MSDMVDAIMHTCGRLDTLVRSAGGLVGRDPVPNTAVADREVPLHQNVTTTMVFAQAAANICAMITPISPAAPVTITPWPSSPELRFQT